MFGFLGKLLRKGIKYIPGVGPAIDDALDVMDVVKGVGDAASGVAQGMAKNRGNELSALEKAAMINNQNEDSFQKNLMARAQEDRAAANNAFKRAQQAAYVASRNQQPEQPGFSPYTRKLAPVSQDVIDLANSQLAQDRDSIMSGRWNTNGGAPLAMPERQTFAPDPKLLKGSMMEKLLGYGGGIAGGIGTAFRKRNTDEESD